MRLANNKSGFAHLLIMLLVVLALAVIGFTGWRVFSTLDPWEQRVADGVGQTTCTTKPPTFPKNYYQGQLVDAHFHPANIPDADPASSDKSYLNEKLYTSLGVNITMGDFVCMFKSDGSTPKNVLAFFPAFPGTHKYSIEVVRQTTKRYPGVFVPFLNPPGSCNETECSQTVDAQTLDEMLSLYPRLFKGYGEIGLYGHEGGPKPLPPDAPRLRAVYKTLRKHGVKKVYLHLGEGQKESFSRALKANRDITFIFHGDQLVYKNEDGSQNFSQIDELLDNNPNLYYGVDEFWMDTFLLHETGSKKEVLDHLSDYGPLLKYDVATWKPFIERHPDQVMWDTDRGTYLWTTDIEVGKALVKYARRFIAELSPAVQEKYAYKNAEKAYATE